MVNTSIDEVNELLKWWYKHCTNNPRKDFGLQNVWRWCKDY